METKAREESHSHVSEFRDVDHAETPAGLEGMMDAFAHYQGLRELKDKAISLSGIKEGMSAVDLACGAGPESIRHAQIVGSEGRIAAVDKSRIFLGEVQKRCACYGLENVIFTKADAMNLPFKENTFDVGRSERLLMYVDAPEKVLTELFRVIKPGGVVYAIEPDWDTMTVNLDDRNLVRRLFQYVCDKQMASGWIGRELPGLFKKCGFRGIHVECATVILAPGAIGETIKDFARQASRDGIFSKAEKNRWNRKVDSLQSSGDLFMTQSMIMVLGRTPS